MSTATSSSPLSAANLEYYRKQAKSLVRSVNAAEPDAFSRVRQQLPLHSPDRPFLLSDAQWVLAREHGFQNWAAFKQHVETEAPTEQRPPEGPESQQVGVNVSTYAPSMKDEAVKAKTGKDWAEWFAIFDAAGGAKMSHKEIVAIAREHGAGSWWQQMVTVEYERARGLRQKFESCDGDVRVNASRTINAPAEAVFAAWADPEKRELWLPKSGLTIRKATCPKSLRITWSDETNVDVLMTPKGDSKCSCNVEHGKLGSTDQVEPRKAFWAEAMARLKEFVEG
jgi:hypothetical protein